MVKLNISIDKDLRKKLKLYCLNNDISIKDCVAGAIKKLLEKEVKK